MDKNQKYFSDIAEHCAATPKHYDKAIQPIHALEAWMSSEEYKGFLVGNIIKYLARNNDKGGPDDIKKAAYYMNILVNISK